MKTNCAVCNKEIDRKPSQIKKYKHLFCSDECKKKGGVLKTIDKYKEYLQITDMKEWLYQKYAVERLSIRQIMKLLNTNANKGISSMLEFYGIEIRHGSEAIKTQWEDNDERKKQQAEFCMEKFTGVKNANYNSNLDRLNNVKRNIAGNKPWRRQILEKYNHKCDKCNSEENLQTHHLYGWKEYPDKRFDLDNGVCLCEKCHREFHNRYGKQNNTPEQYNDFKED